MVCDGEGVRKPAALLAMFPMRTSWPHRRTLHAAELPDSVQLVRRSSLAPCPFTLLNARFSRDTEVRRATTPAPAVFAKAKEIRIRHGPHRPIPVLSPPSLLQSPAPKTEEVTLKSLTPYHRTPQPFPRHQGRRDRFPSSLS